MPILRMRDATYSSGSTIVVPPTSLDVGAGERVAHLATNDLEAEAVAMMAAALLLPSAGSVLLGAYDPRIQPAHCKRIAGFVPHDPLPLGEMSLRRYIEYRAALWGIDRERAFAHAELLLDRLHGLHTAFAYPLVGALVANPQVLVVDRPQPSARAAILEAAGPCAVFETAVA